MKNFNRYFAIIVALLIMGSIAYYFSSIVAYILIAWGLSMIGHPIKGFFQARLKIGKFQAGASLSAALTLVCYFIIFTLLVWMFVPLILEQANNLAGVDYTAIAAALDEPINELNTWANEMGLQIKEKTPAEQVQETMSGWFEPSMIGDFFSSLVAVAGNLFIGLFSIIFITFFFLKEQGLFAKVIIDFLPKRREQQIRNTIDDISRLLTRYFSGILLQMTIITTFVWIGLSILGVKNAILIGFFAGLINVIPYLGPLIGAAFAVFITISSNLDLDFYSQMLPLISKVIAVFALLQMLDNFILQPFIFSNSVLAHPLEIFIIILAGAQIGGVLGMILAIPTYTVFRVIARSFLSEFRVVQKITEGMKE